MRGCIGCDRSFLMVMAFFVPEDVSTALMLIKLSALMSGGEGVVVVYLR